jgi:hypothetical protein
MASTHAAQRNDYDEAVRLFHSGAYEASLAHVLSAARDHGEIEAVWNSYGLGLWMKLADAYPPARAALEEARRAAWAAYQAGMTAKTVRELIAMEQAHKNADQLIRIVREVSDSHPELLLYATSAAWRTIAEAGEFEIARRCIRSPDDEVRYAVDMFQRRLPVAQRASHPRLGRLSVLIQLVMLAREVRLIADIAAATEGQDQREPLLDLAMGELDDASLGKHLRRYLWRGIPAYWDRDWHARHA